MDTSQEQLDSFHRFATDKLNNGDSKLSMQELVALWEIENPSDEERAEVNAIIRQGLADIAAGRGQDAAEVSEALRRKHNLPAE